MVFTLRIIICVLILCFTYVSGALVQNLLVKTQLGFIRGVEAKDGDYNMFLGIPYAKVNSSNIFGNAVPYPPFEEVFEANNDSTMCPQIEEFNQQPVGTIDCLHLNMYVPNSVPPKEGFPVLFYIYGGSFMVGFAGRYMYGPKYLVRHDIIFITFNYRLGPYGFMCLHTPEIPGNAGLKDQDDALRWVKKNIESFGGDANTITICGNSAGAMAVGLHLVSESEKLFSNVIMQSGSALHPHIITDEDVNAPLKLAAELGLETDNRNEALYFLSNADVRSVVRAAASVTVTFGVCIEKSFSGTRRYLADHPLNINPLKAKNISILQGYNSNEWMMGFENAGPEKDIDPELLFKFQLSKVFDLKENISEAESIVRFFYIGNNEINHNVKWELTDFLSDFWSIYPSIRSLRGFIACEADKIYQYLFSYDSLRNFIKRRDNLTGVGTNHADEIGYLFDMKGLSFIPTDNIPDDQLIIDRMTTMWANFVKYGDPTPELNELLPVKWKPVTKDSPHHYLEINTVMRAGKAHLHQRISFWDLFYKIYERSSRKIIQEDREELSYFELLYRM